MTTRKALVCTCEDVTDTEVHDALQRGCRDLETLKRYTGLATGPCQGKSCVTLARALLAEAGVPAAEAGGITLRAPSRPIPLRFLAGEDQEGAP